MERNTKTSVAVKLDLIDTAIREVVGRLSLPGKQLAANKDFQDSLIFSLLNPRNFSPDGISIDEVNTLSRLVQSYSSAWEDLGIELYIWQPDSSITGGLAAGVFHLSEIDSLNFYTTIRKKREIQLIREPFASMGEIDPAYIYLTRQFYRLFQPTIPFGGIVLTKIPVESFRIVLSRNVTTPTGTTFVIDSEGWIQVSSDTELEGVNLLDEFPATSLDDNQILFFRSSYQNRAMWVSAKKTLLDWYLVLVSPLDEVFDALTKLSRILFLILGVNLFLSGLLSLSLSRQMAKPIEYLVASIRRVQDGDFTPEIHYKRDDEFSHLIEEYNTMLGRIDTLMNELVEVEQRRNEAEMSALQAQINPHFLYNTLDTINWLALDGGQKNISEMVTWLSDFFRYSLSKGRKVIPLGDEIKQVTSFLMIEKLQYPDVFEFYIDFPEELSEYKTVKLILQPLVENAIVHGFKDIDRKGYIEIIVTEHDQSLEIEVSDNGRGSDINRLNEAIHLKESPSECFAVCNINNRIVDNFGAAFGLTFLKNDERGITARVVFPKEEIEQ